MSVFEDEHRHHEIIKQGVAGGFTIVTHAHSKQLAGSTHGGIEIAVPLFQGTLIFPVDAFSLGSGLSFVACLNTFLARNTTDIGLHELAHYLADGIGVEHRVSISEYHVFCFVLTQTMLHGCCLTLAFWTIYKGYVGICLKEFVGVVVTSIGYPHNT